MTQYLIFGAGAIGTLLGGHLAQAGHDVTFIGRKWNCDGIRNKGIQISGVWGESLSQPQAAYESVEDIPEKNRHFDQIIITVKAFDTAHAIEACLPVIGDKTIVISFQNGYGNCQIIAKKIGWERTLGARIITGVEITKPGKVNVTVHADAIRLGHYLRQIPIERIQNYSETMREAGIPIEATEDLEHFIWAKILYNAALNPLGALLGVTYGELANNTETRNIMNRIIHEAFEATHACGISHFWLSPNEYIKAFYETMLPPTATHFPSMLRDLQKGRRTEINALNGAITKLGIESQIPTITNDTIVSLIQFREKNLST